MDGVGPARELLDAMARDMAHRGPDEQGIEVGAWWGLASRRLAIIGIETGRQPLSNEDGSVWVAFNGEIYNHWDLREDLSERGHIFSSRTDTEVLVHLYEEYGEELVAHLEGMFAFGIVDCVRERVLLARDRLGQKPLHYAVLGSGETVFASECRTLLCHSGIPRDLDLQSLGDYLSLGVVPSPRSIFASIRKLPPACTLTFERGVADLSLSPSFASASARPRGRCVSVWSTRFHSAWNRKSLSGRFCRVGWIPLRLWALCSSMWRNRSIRSL
jgi:asparagine synthase (glutamine-hydrolysing)